MHAEPFTCLRPAPAVAADVAALPYDVYDRAEAKAAVAGRPLSFLNIDRPETQFPDDQDMYAPEVYAKAAELLRDELANGTFVRDGVPCYYLYRLVWRGRTQTGIVACCSVDDYEDGTIKRHENTRADKEADRIRHIQALDAQTGPIFLAYRDSLALDVIVSAATSAQPLYDFEADDGVRHTVWRVSRPDAVEAIEATFERIPCAYIADGHHRAASAVKAALAKRAANPGNVGVEPYNSFLSVLFPAGQLQILPYNRVVADTNGLGAEGLVEACERVGLVVGPEREAPVEPACAGRFGMYVGGSWRELSVDPASVGDDPVASLDASVLQDRLLGPVLGIADPRTDPRISFVGGIRGTDELERRAGEEGVAFALHATSIEQLMAVADAGLLMPPKSTWFEPKLRSGLFVHRI